LYAGAGRWLESLAPSPHHYRRQHPIRPYVADFYCADARLVVEEDGNHHGEPAQVEHDEIRDAWMTTQGLNVIRFTVHEVVEKLDDVKARIWVAARLVRF